MVVVGNMLEGLDVTARAELTQRVIWARIPGGRDAFDNVSVDLAGSDPALLRITVMGADRALTGRAFSAAVIETALASYPGLYSLTPPRTAFHDRGGSDGSQGLAPKGKT
jgi:hypothetical protein